MKRTVAYILISAAWVLPSLAQQTHLDIKVSDVASERLKGAVKSVETDLCVNVSAEHKKVREEYDPIGNRVATLNWGNDGELANTTTNFYDENGCFYLQQYMSFGKKGVTNDWKVVLNPETRQIAMKNDRTGSIAIRTYSPEKQLVHYRFMDKEKKQKSASRNTWNENNQRTEYIKYDEKNRPLYTYWFKWREDGLIEKERLHDYEYLVVDDCGNWTQRLMVRYDIGGKEKEKVYERTTIRTIEYFD
ncbi:hypothetical protein [Pontiella sulfatireligans]|uniref:Uncharacterized protein n=1 Tax=Pontiella sulfatireligans TaxID=2750658 RepID=A0A6C2UHL9_9BACT|nr:hypothetical protein [Pontiella sulfatireligans]VGO19690.1 hypothetical protein SCARR_01749 [Pontiella sulfatireligans]